MSDEARPDGLHREQLRDQRSEGGRVCMHRSEPCRFLLAGINSYNKIYLKRINITPAEARAKPRVLNEVGVTLRQNVGALTQVARFPNHTFY